jgi:ketosteroid isomerase-like protein
MTAADVAIAMRCIEAINDRDADTLIALSAPDIEIIPLRAALEDTVYRGAEGIVQWMRDVEETWHDLRIELDEPTEIAPGVVLGVGMIHARGHASDAPTTMPATLVAWVRDGLVTKAGTFPDRDAALRAVGGES